MKKGKRKERGSVVKLCFMMVLLLVMSIGIAFAQQGFGSPMGGEWQLSDGYNFSETLPAENFFNENGPYLRDDEDDEYDEEDNGPGGNGHGAADGVGVPVGEGLLILLLDSMLYGGLIFNKNRKM